MAKDKREDFAEKHERLQPNDTSMVGIPEVEDESEAYDQATETDNQELMNF